MKADLHTHTHHSDGTFSPKELVARAKAAGITVLSITDHDSVAGIAEAKLSAGKDLEIIPGVEITVAFRDRELHILGYGLDVENPELTAFFSRMQVYRVDRIKRMIERLNAKGISVTFEEVARIAGTGSIGRPHLAEVLMKRKFVKNLQEAFEKHIGDHAPCFVKGATLTPAQAVALIRGAGGVSSLAHPYRIVADAWIPELVADGVQGIEAYHSDQEGSIAERYRRIAEKHGLLVTGGSDCHGLRKMKGPLIGTVAVPEECIVRLKEAIWKQQGSVRPEPVEGRTNMDHPSTSSG